MKTVAVYTALLLLTWAGTARAQFTFTTNNGTITITKYTGVDGNVIIPSAINGYPVTSIGSGTSSISFSLTSVAIPNSVTNINSYAFYLCGLTNITIPDSVTSIGKWVFACSGLNSMMIGNGAVAIDPQAFYGSSLARITIPYNVTNIGVYPFKQIDTLTNFTVDAANPCYASADGVLFNKGMTTLTAFPNGLASSYVIPNSVTSIASNAFASCWSLANLTIGSNVTNIGDHAFAGCGLTNIVIDGGVTSLGPYAFAACKGLQRVIFQGNAPSVNGGSGNQDITVFSGEPGMVFYYSGTSGWGTAFGGWPTSTLNPMLDILVQPISQTSTNGRNAAFTVLAIGTAPLAYQWYFDGSPISNATSAELVLTNLTFDNAGSYYTVITNDYGSVTSSVATLTVLLPLSFTTNNGTITITGWKRDYAFPTGDLVIPGTINGYNVTVIGPDALQENATLTSVTIPDSVTNICERAFWDCTHLGNVVIGSNVISLGDQAFEFCSGLTSISIGNSVTSVGDEAFEACSGLTNVSIGNGVTNIGSYTFDGCFGLTNIAVDTANPSYASAGGVLFNKDMTKLIKFAPGLTGSYAIPDSVTSIGDYAFYWSPGLWSVTIPNGVTNIGSSAFSETSLTSVTIPGSVANMGVCTFTWCSSLTNVFFQGNAPTVDGGSGGADFLTFYGANTNGTVYYLPGASGWTNTFGGWPTALWFQPLPTIRGTDHNFSLHSNRFDFTISWATNTSVIIQTCSNLADPVWSPITTNTLSNGVANFSDPYWTNAPSRYYRVRTQ